MDSFVLLFCNHMGFHSSKMSTKPTGEWTPKMFRALLSRAANRGMIDEYVQDACNLINAALAAERERTEQFARAQAKANARLCEIEPDVQQLREQLHAAGKALPSGAQLVWEETVAADKAHGEWTADRIEQVSGILEKHFPKGFEKLSAAIKDSIELAYQKGREDAHRQQQDEIDRLQSQLAAAQAAIKRYNMGQHPETEPIKSDTAALDAAKKDAIANLTGPKLLELLQYPSRQYALDEYVAAAQQPLVDALTGVLKDLREFKLRYPDVAFFELTDAQVSHTLAKVKEGKDS